MLSAKAGRIRLGSPAATNQVVVIEWFSVDDIAITLTDNIIQKTTGAVLAGSPNGDTCVRCAAQALSRAAMGTDCDRYGLR